jgi:glutamine synthetase
MESIVQALHDEFGLTPVMAAEIECYVMLSEVTQESADEYFEPLARHWQRSGVPILRIEKERGHRQFEIVTQVTTPARLVKALQMIRRSIETSGVESSFAAKPFADQPSSGLHLHLHLADSEGINAYHKTEEWTSDALRWSLGGLLLNLEASLPIFFPTEQDYVRLDDPDHVPKLAGWGVNNRYCALRIPTNEDPYAKRIEHRVPCANADPYAAIDAILVSVLQGLREKLEPPPQEFGKPNIGLLESLALTAMR